MQFKNFTKNNQISFISPNQGLCFDWPPDRSVLAKLTIKRSTGLLFDFAG